MTCKTCRGSGFINLADCPDCNSKTIAPSPMLRTITVSEKQLEIIRTLLTYKVGGSPQGPRGKMDDLMNYLDSIGVQLAGGLCIRGGCIYIEYT